MPADERRAGPRYRRLADTLIGQIRAGKLKMGETLPGEHELVVRHGVSRHTVREALRVLEDLGLIDRQQGIGTVVRARNPAMSYVQTVRSPAELMNYPRESRLAVQGTAPVRASRQLARQLGVRVGSQWMHVNAIRRIAAGVAPIAYTDVYLVPEYAGIIPQIGRKAGRVYELVEAKYGEHVERVAMEIRAGLLSADVARQLGMKEGAPSLSVVRRYYGRGNRLFQVALSEHPAERYEYSFELKRGWRADDTWTT